MKTEAIETRLHEIGHLADDDVPVVETLVLLGALDKPEITDLTPYWRHIEELHQALGKAIETDPLPEDAASQDINLWRLDRLRKVLFDGFGYHADAGHEGFSVPEKINFLDVLTARSGIPVALGALFYELAKAQGWAVCGLAFPGHFIMRLEHGGARLIFDPFDKGQVLDAALMRALLKGSLGPQAELSHDYSLPVSARDIVLRFCNNRKLRFLQLGNYDAALQTVLREMAIAPDEPLLYFDGGILAFKLDRLAQALEFLHGFVERSDDAPMVAEARSMILSLQRRLQ